MELTQKQQLQINRYLRDVEEHLEQLDPDSRQQVVRRLDTRIMKELEKSSPPPLDDKVVAVTLHRFGAPADLAAHIVERRPAAAGKGLAGDDERRWLGVCAALAQRHGLNVRWLRFVAVLLGLFTGPVAVTVYLAVYLEIYLTSNNESMPRVSKLDLARNTLGTLFGAAAFYGFSRAVLFGLSYAYVRFMEKSAPSLGKWGWLEPNATPMFVLVLTVLMPLAILSGLPLANQWDQTLKRVVQAGLAVYALVLSAGIASVLTGIILVVVKEFTG